MTFVLSENMALFNVHYVCISCFDHIVTYLWRFILAPLILKDLGVYLITSETTINEQGYALWLQQVLARVLSN